MSQSDGVYARLLEKPGDASTMLVLADALDDEGRWELANAYRWAAERGKWPWFSRWRGRRAGQQVTVNGAPGMFDWDLEGREVERQLTAGSHLPRDLYDAMRHLAGRVYGGVDRSFILLANVLAGYKTYREL